MSASSPPTAFGELGVDTGGTFTDFVLWRDGRLRVHKAPSRPDNPAQAVAEGLAALGLPPAQVRLAHGTTVATNALLERKGARLFLVVDAGFEDLLTIGRQDRPALYNPRVARPAPLVDPDQVAGVEAADPDGAAAGLADRLAAARPEVVCVCLLNAYADPTAESRLAERLTALGHRVLTSHQVLPEYREFERFSTTVLNGYVAPVMERYIGHLESEVRPAVLQIMQSNGGTLSARAIGRRAIHTLLSGPAAGVVGARAVAALAGYDQILTFDMGGTSTDVALIPKHLPFTTEAVFAGWPARIPIIDIHTVGAGGGSIARVDPGGLLKVGPQSAGAEPGPACYGRGEALTVTDANLHLGRISPEAFLGGRMPLHPERVDAPLRALAMACGRPPDEVAEGVLAVAEAHMLRALRVISIQRGHLPADFTLVTFGGAGGLHAAALARELGVRRVLVPPLAGVLSALGLLLADTVKDYVAPLFAAAPAGAAGLPPAVLAEPMVELTRQALADMTGEGFPPEAIDFLPAVDARYAGQSWELTLTGQPGRIGLELARRHQERYGYTPSDRAWEVVNIRLRAVGRRPQPDLRQLTPAGGDAPAPTGRRRVLWRGRSLDTPVRRLADLPRHTPLAGPLVVVDPYSTIWVPPDCQAVGNDIGGLELWPQT